MNNNIKLNLFNLRGANLFDGKKLVNIKMKEFDGNRWSQELALNFFYIGALKYIEEINAYVVGDVDHCIEAADDWKYNRGECRVCELGENGVLRPKLMTKDEEAAYIENHNVEVEVLWEAPYYDSYEESLGNDNLGWCRNYTIEDSNGNEAEFTECEGKITSVAVNGKDVDLTAAVAENVKQLAENGFPTEYGCVDCRWYSICQAHSDGITLYYDEVAEKATEDLSYCLDIDCRNHKVYGVIRDSLPN